MSHKRLGVNRFILYKNNKQNNKKNLPLNLLHFIREDEDLFSFSYMIYKPLKFFG